MKTEIDVNLTSDQLAEMFICWGDDEQARFINLIGEHFKKADFNAELQCCCLANGINKLGKGIGNTFDDIGKGIGKGASTVWNAGKGITKGIYSIAERVTSPTTLLIIGGVVVAVIVFTSMQKK